MKTPLLWTLLAAASLAFVRTAPGLLERVSNWEQIGPEYNRSTEITVRGTVKDVSQVAGPTNWGGIHLMLKAEKMLDVYLGPATFLSQKQFVFAKEDQIRVKGSFIKFRGINTVLAREILKDGKTLTLRDAQGVPQWNQ